MDAETPQSQPQPESTETFYKAMAWFHANQKRLIFVVIVVVAIGLVLGIMSWNKQREEADANKQFFELPVGSGPGAAPVAAPSPSTYLDLASQYPNTTAGEYSVLLGAEALFEAGKYPESQSEFSKFIDDHPDSPLVSQASVGVAACLEAEGKLPEAIQKYQAIISGNPNDPQITAPAKLTLARLYDESNRPDQAMSLYADLARSQNPNDPWAAEARERGQLLLARHPELMKSQQQAPSPNSSFSLTPPGNPAQSAPPKAAPAPQIKTQNPPVNLLSIPSASSNAPGNH
ncbi:MAG TPA: tetratricopeptide repeat protein [Verrucomicrobiae bacterium]|jgi:predicted negative regulator of RcsB-dependent stress response|nr:tetratricopeptide repeat protein [Verrucomicrobiae bacterium]